MYNVYVHANSWHQDIPELTLEGRDPELTIEGQDPELTLEGQDPELTLEGQDPEFIYFQDTRFSLANI